MALVWWSLEVILTSVAQRGHAGALVRAFLILPAARPTALSTTVELLQALDREQILTRGVKHSASGWPDVIKGPESAESMGATLIELESNRSVLIWGKWQPGPQGKASIV